MIQVALAVSLYYTVYEISVLLSILWEILLIGSFPVKADFCFLEPKILLNDTQHLNLPTNRILNINYHYSLKINILNLIHKKKDQNFKGKVIPLK